MSAPLVGEVLDSSYPLEPTMPELMVMASDIVAMVDGRVTFVNVAQGTVSVHVASQDIAEYLAWRLALDKVTDYAPTESAGGPFTVWEGGAWPLPQFKVFCAADLIRPVRAFPRQVVTVLPVDLDTRSEVA